MSNVFDMTNHGASFSGVLSMGFCVERGAAFKCSKYFCRLGSYGFVQKLAYVGFGTGMRGDKQGSFGRRVVMRLSGGAFG